MAISEALTLCNAKCETRNNNCITLMHIQISCVQFIFETDLKININFWSSHSHKNHPVNYLHCWNEKWKLFFIFLIDCWPKYYLIYLQAHSSTVTIWHAHGYYQKKQFTTACDTDTKDFWNIKFLYKTIVCSGLNDINNISFRRSYS